MEAVAARQSERRLAKVKIGGRGFISHQMLGLFFFMLWRVINQVSIGGASLQVLLKRDLFLAVLHCTTKKV